jgi:hypothetical protein
MEHKEQNQQFTEETVKEDKPKNKGGKPPWIPSEEDLEKAEKLAGQGMTQRQIADCLGIGYGTLFDKKIEFPEFAEAIKRGKAAGIAYVSNKLMDKVGAMDTTSIIFYLKCQAGWKETSTLEVTGEGGGPLIASNVSIEDYLKARKQILDEY